MLDKQDARYALMLSVAAHYSLLPLLFTAELQIIKITLYIAYMAFMVYCVNQFHPNWHRLLTWTETRYVYGFGVVYLYDAVIQYTFSLNEKYEFLPLLLTSLYCSLGCCIFWITYYVRFIVGSDYFNGKSKKKRLKKKKTK